MAYVTVPKDLTRVKSKIVFGLTKRQLICFGGALLVGVPLYFLLRGRVTGSAAALIMVFAMLPGFLLALYERHGQPLEVVVWQIVQCCFILDNKSFLISGGDFGIEASIISILVYLLFIVLAAIQVKRKGTKSKIE